MTPATSAPSVVRSMPSVHRTSRVCTAKCSSKPTNGPAGCLLGQRVQLGVQQGNLALEVSHALGQAAQR
ncbi:MAG: hypothetical protein E6G66_09905, partial [Actinobacteria bacterium]